MKKNLIYFQAMHDFNVDLGIKGFLVCSTVVFLFLYCYIGERTAQNYLSFGQLLYGSNWHQLPVRLQKPIIMVIAIAQRPLCYHGLGMVYLTLDTFCKVSIHIMQKIHPMIT